MYDSSIHVHRVCLCLWLHSILFTFQWLQTEALQNNPKIEASDDGTRFAFKAVFKLKDGKSLLKLLKQHDLKGLGGVLLDDVQESLPHCEKVLKSRANDIIYVVRPTDKKKILFYNDRTANMNVSVRLIKMEKEWVQLMIDFDLQVDEEFQKLWRSVTVESLDDAKIDEYLEKQGSSDDQLPIDLLLSSILMYFSLLSEIGIRSMQDHGPKKALIPKRKKTQLKKRQFKKPRDNEHLADVLETYEDNTITQEGAKIAQS